MTSLYTILMSIYEMQVVFLSTSIDYTFSALSQNKPFAIIFITWRPSCPEKNTGYNTCLYESDILPSTHKACWPWSLQYGYSFDVGKETDEETFDVARSPLRTSNRTCLRRAFSFTWGEHSWLKSPSQRLRYVWWVLFWVGSFWPLGMFSFPFTSASHLAATIDSDLIKEVSSFQR